MVSVSVVFYKIATTCLIIFVGYIVKRMQLIPENSVSFISKYILLVALPSYMIYYTPSSVSLESLHLYWFYPVLGLSLIALSDLCAYLVARYFARPGDLATVRFLVGVPNWVFMALVVCEPIFREEGIRVVLLYNIGITLYLWTLGMSSFRPGVGFWQMLRNLFINLQSIAMAIGVVFALTCPFFRGMEKLRPDELAALPLGLRLLTPAWETIYMLGMTAMPLTLFQIGIMLGRKRVLEGSKRLLLADAAAAGKWERGDYVWMGVVGVLRLLTIPFLLMLGLGLALKLGLPLNRNEYVISMIIMAMPPAVGAMSVAEVYGGNVRLTAMSLLWLTVAALATAPLAVWGALAMHAWLFPAL